MIVTPEGLHIGLDVDEVLSQFTNTFIKFHNERYQTNLTVPDFVTYSYEKVMGMSLAEMVDRLDIFYASEYFSGMPTVDGALEGIQALTGKHNLYAITSRPDKLKGPTEDWLRNNFAGSISQIHFAYNIQGNFGGRRKVEIGKDLGIDLAIDDSLDHAVDYARLGIPTLLLDMDYPWNQGETPENVTRVRSWQEITHRIQNRLF